MIQRLGFNPDSGIMAEELLARTIVLLREQDISYQGFFAELSQEFDVSWREDRELILNNATFADLLTDSWRDIYHQCLNKIPLAAVETMKEFLNTRNPQTALSRPVIESVWQPIDESDDWQPFYDLVDRLQQKAI